MTGMLVLDKDLVALAVLLVFVALGGLARSLLDRSALPWADGTHQVAYLVLRALRLPLWLFFVAAGLDIAGRTFLSETLAGQVERGLVVLFAALVTLSLARLSGGIAGYYADQREDFRPLAGMVNRVGQIAIWGIGLTMVLGYLEQPILPLLTTLGVAGLAVALALQDTLANFFAGFYILADRPIRVGDYVKLESGQEGFVLDVGWRSAKIRTLQNNVVIIPNNKLAQSIITNYHLPERRMSIAIPVSVGYAEDPDRIERVLLDVAQQATGEIDGLLAEPPPFVRFIPGFGAHSLDFTLLCQVREFVDQYLVQHELRKRILRRLREDAIEIPYPTQTIRVEDGQPVLAGAAAREPSEVARKG